MSSQFSLTTFNSKGKLKQIENALKAVSKGDTAVGIKYKSGVVLVCQKKLKSVLIDETSFQKIQRVSANVGSTYAGLSCDFRVLQQYARKKNLSYKLRYHEPILVENIVRQTAKVFQEFT